MNNEYLSSPPRIEDTGELHYQWDRKTHTVCIDIYTGQLPVTVHLPQVVYELEDAGLDVQYVEYHSVESGAMVIESSDKYRV